MPGIAPPRRRLRNAAVWLAVLGLSIAAGARVHAATPPQRVAAASSVHRVLFDNTKAETAGNADWIISTSQPDPLQQDPSPQTETDWTGALSSWGVALQKTGQYSLDTLPSGNTITYGNTANALDLSHFDAFVLDEPNVQLSSAEKAALMHFVQNGGGLFLISDHTGSDRNNDGWDSPRIINDLLTNNGVDNSDPFGLSVDSLDISTDNPVAIQSSTDPIINGPFGKVTGSILRDGTTFTLHPADNPNVRGLVWLTSANQSGTTGAFVVSSTFGSGRVAIWGDSSPADDGTGQSGNTLYDGWNDPAGTDAAIALNATAWLAGDTGGTSGGVSITNPGAQTGTVGTAARLQISASDTAGGTLSYQATGLPAGLSINASTGLISGTPTTAGTGQVTVTATDSTGPSGSTSFTWTINGTGGQLLGNPGFETGSAAPWSGTTNVIYSGTKEPSHTGSWDAWLDGYGTTTTDTLSQQVTIPSTAGSATLSYWLHIDTAETGTTAYDTLKVQLLNSSGTVLATLATYSNVDHVTGYVQHTANLNAYIGQTVTLRFTGAEDYTKQTSFVLDDTALTTT
jgi:Putative Ig domain